MARKPHQLIYGVEDKPPIFFSIIVAFQHILIMSTSLLFPAIVISAATHSNPTDAISLTSSTMLAMAIGTFLLQFKNKWIGAGFLCPAICEPAYLAIAVYALSKGSLALLFGMGLLAGLFEILLSFGLKFAKKLIPTEVTGVVVMMIGINLITPDIKSAFHLVNTSSLIASNSLILFGATLVCVIALSVWGPKRIPIYSIVISAIIGYVLAYFMGLFPEANIAKIQSASLFSLPRFNHLFNFDFNMSLLLPFFVAAFSAAIKAVGNITTAQKTSDDDWVRPEMGSIRRAVFTDGLATMISSSLGGMPMGTSSSNVAYTLPSRCAARWVNIVISIALVILSFVPKISLLLVYMPSPVRSALLSYVICFMIVAGLQIVSSRMLDLRKTLIIGLSIGLGLATNFLPQIVNELPRVLQPIFKSSLSTATLSAFVLNILFRIGIKRRVKLEIDLKDRNRDKVREFFDKQGKLWAALPLMIKKAQDASLECIHAIKAFKLDNKDVVLTVNYDEYTLQLDFEYKGPKLSLPHAMPDLKDASSGENTEQALALFLMQSHINEFSSSTEKGVSKASLKICS